MSAPILSTKLYIPPLRPGAVRRPQLVARLNAGHKLTLISAPAGFGKTTLVSEWVNQRIGESASGNSVAWLSLDEGDNDPGRFLTYCVAALQTLALSEAEGIAPDVGAGIVAALQSPQPPPVEALLAALLNEIAALPERVTLVLDDYHALDSPPIDAALAFLLDHQPPQLHLVIATREDPSLPLARLRARGQLTELRAADLRFTPAEAADFLNRVMALELSENDVAALEARTEGWIAGLQLAALALHGQSDNPRFVATFTGSHRFVLDYLLEEVLHCQPPDIQDFLLRTAILDRLCGPLCEAVLETPPDSGQKMLATLDRANLFLVPLDDERRWYRYHHLFGDLLRQRLQQNSPPLSSPPVGGTEGGSVAALHLHASAWYEQNELLLEAFRHAAAANDVARAERLLESPKMALHFRSVTLPVLEWLTALPEQVLDARPQLWVRAAALTLMTGQTAGVEEKLQAAEKALQGVAQDDAIRDLIGQIACARATLALTRYDPETMLAQARRALAHLRPDNLAFRFTANWALASASLLQGDRVTVAHACREGVALSQQSGDGFSMILATSDLGEIQELDNQLHQAAESYRRALQLAGEHPQPNIGEVYLGLARIHYEWNDLTTATQHAEQSLRLMRQYDQKIDRFIVALAFLARLNLAQNDLSGAEARLAQAEQAVRRPQFARRAPEVAAARVLVLLRQGQYDAAAHLAQAHPLPLSQARVHLAQGRPSAALALVEPLRQEAETKGWQDERLKTLVLQAALQAHGEAEAALQVLNEALTLAEPGGFIRIFVDEGLPMAQLLSAAYAQGIFPDYTTRLLAAWKAESQPRQDTVDAPLSHLSSVPPWFEPLTPREQDILRLLVAGRSNPEIAAELVVAVTTVKTHVKHIYGKLQVTNRVQAVARAQALKLV